jgi:predicted metal-binding protein
MGGCSHACTLAIQAKGKLRYLFGGLDATSESVSQAIVCAKIHDTNNSGQIPWAERPSLFQKGMIARLPQTLAD